MKKTSKILLFVMALLIFSHAFVQPSFAVDSTDDFTREDAVELFEKAMECCRILQFAYPHHIGTEENTGYFDYSVCENGKVIGDVYYFMVNKNHKYGTLEKTQAWAESIFTKELSDKYIKINIYVQYFGGKSENFLYDDEGNLWKAGYSGQLGLTTKYNVLGFRSDGTRAVLTLESWKRFGGPGETVANTVKFEKTDAGWRVSESGYFNYCFGIAPPDGSPETGDDSPSRAAVFAVGAVLAAVAPVMMMTVKRRREEK